MRERVTLDLIGTEIQPQSTSIYSLTSRLQLSMLVRTTVVFRSSCIRPQSSYLRTYTTLKHSTMTSKSVSAASAKAQDFLDFVNASPTRTYSSSEHNKEPLLTQLKPTMPYTPPLSALQKLASPRSKNGTAGPVPFKLVGNTT